MSRPLSPPRRRAAALALTGLAALGLVVGAVAPATAATTGKPTPASTGPAAPDPIPRVAEGDLATAPYMGWSSYSLQVYTGENHIIDADQIIAQSDAMHDKLQQFGYNRINIDAAWNDGFDAHGRPTPSAEHYPDGLQTVIDHVHANGQEIGLYFIPGVGPEVYEAALPVWNAPGCTTHDIAKQPLTKADYWGIGYALDFENPCTTAYIESMAAMLEDWGVDFVKFDSVTPGSGISDLSIDARADVAAWSKALHSRGIWFELSWALDPAYADYWREHADGWRVDWDVECYCENDAMVSWQTISRTFGKAEEWWRHTGPGGFADFDSLNVGNGRMDGLTADERRTAATLWAMQAAQFFTGDDLTRLDKLGIELLTNKEVIAIDQAGIPAHPVSSDTKRPVWASLQDDGSYAVALYNLGTSAADITVDWTSIGLADGKNKVRDVWARKDIGTHTTGYTADAVPPHGVRLLRVTPPRGVESTVNGDAIQVGYSGDWHRSGGDEVAATSQDLAVSVLAPGEEAPAAGDTSHRIVTLNDTSPEIAYSGSWNHSTGRGVGDHENDVHWTEKVGDSVSLTFRGTGIRYITEKDESQGRATVTLDGEAAGTADASLPAGTARQAQQVVWSATGLDDGEHTVTLTMQDGRFMLLDRFDIEQVNLLDPNAIAVPQGAAEATRIALGRDAGELTGIANGTTALKAGVDWTIDGGDVVLSAAYLSSLKAGQTALRFSFRGDVADDVQTASGEAWTDLTFTGTGVTWIAPTAPDQGEVRVFIDGKLVKTVDTHADTRRTQQELYAVSGLKRGEHRIVVQKATGDVIRSDAFRFTR